MNAALSIPIDKELLINISIDGIECSCRAYWAEIDRFPSAKMFDDYEARLKDGTLPDEEVLFRLRDDEDGMAANEKRPWADITMATLMASTQRALVEYNHLFTYTVGSDGKVSDIDYDAWGADAILQFATLGEVIYG